MHKEGNYKKLFESFDDLNVLIIGDVMVDSYLWGRVERVSPEAPIPIVALRKRENRMGGAANVAMNIKSMGANPILCSVIGTDDKGDQFIDLLRKERITDDGIVRSGRRITTTKFRIFGNAYQMLRVDEEMEEDLAAPDLQTLLRVIEQIMSKVPIGCIIFQDYDKGVITPKLIEEVVNRAGIANIPVAVDPKRKNFMAYRNVTLFKPNLKEMKEGLHPESDLDDNQSVIDAAHKLRELLDCKYVLTTMSERGMMMCANTRNEESNFYIPAHMRLISDVSGAGDTVISVASLCLAMNRSPHEIAYISNLAGGLVCEEVGVVPVNKEKLLKELMGLL
ncbi:MAG TPA: bifunctional ADP-heptose synthase [Bacteroidales bacterium]|nr:bifunctional ADP-heptose synthase [Bacteroidales bacterium]